MLAMIFAIGISFATATGASDPTTDYILENGNFQPIGMEIDCERGGETCKVQLEPNGQIYEVYDAANPNSKKIGAGEVNRIWEQQ